jgi:hypothetical protein
LRTLIPALLGTTGKEQVMAKEFVVKLSGEERAQLSGLISKGKTAAKTVLKARILLKADQGEAGEEWADEKICEALDTNVSMVSRVRETFVIQGFDAVLTRKQRETPPIAPIFDGERQAQLIALACSERPEGYAHWTIRLLAEHVIERKIVKTAHFNTVGRALKKNALKPHLKEYRVIPPCPLQKRRAKGRYRRLKPHHPALALADRLKRVAEIVLRHGPVQRHALPRPFQQRCTIGRYRRLKTRRPALTLAERSKRGAEIVLRRGPVQRHALSRPDYERRSVKSNCSR